MHPYEIIMLGGAALCVVVLLLAFPGSPFIDYLWERNQRKKAQAQKE